MTRYRVYGGGAETVRQSMPKTPSGSYSENVWRYTALIEEGNGDGEGANSNCYDVIITIIIFIIIKNILYA